MNVGFVGTGTMGAPMLGNLVKKGFGVIGYDVVPVDVLTDSVDDPTAVMVPSTCCSPDLPLKPPPNGT